MKHSNDHVGLADDDGDSLSFSPCANTNQQQQQGASRLARLQGRPPAPSAILLLGLNRDLAGKRRDGTYQVTACRAVLDCCLLTRQSRSRLDGMNVGD
jgi:hypothetical protein